MTAPLRVPAGFGAALYELRKARGWSMLRAAGAAGVSTSVVARAERGGNVGLAQAIRLASAYGTTLGALPGGGTGADMTDPLDTATRLDRQLRTLLGGHVAALGAGELDMLARLRRTIGQVLAEAGRPG